MAACRGAPDCAALSIRDHAREEPEAALRECSAIQDERWRDECVFLVAESALDPAAPQAGLARCAAAGRFEKECLKHLFSSHTGWLLSQPGAAEPAYAALVDAAGLDRPMQDQAWSLFYRKQLEGRSPLDEASCGGTPRPQDCRNAHGEELQRRIRRYIHENGDAALRGACDGSPAEALAPLGLAWVPGPTLDARASETLAPLCRR